MTKEDIKRIVTAMTEAPSCYSDLKERGRQWLAAADTANSRAVMETLLTEAAGDIMPIDQLIGFTASAAGVQLFGADLAKQIHDHAVQIKHAGATHCDCPACAGCAELLNHKEAVLAAL